MQRSPALLEQLGPQNDTPDGKPMPMKLEPWPGGRWYRDLGTTMATSGRLCKPSSGRHCSEFAGPLFMSYPVVSNVQYRLSELTAERGSSFGTRRSALIEGDHRKGVTKGWGHIHEGVRKRAEAKRSR